MVIICLVKFKVRTKSFLLNDNFPKKFVLGGMEGTTNGENYKTMSYSTLQWINIEGYVPVYELCSGDMTENFYFPPTKYIIMAFYWKPLKLAYGTDDLIVVYFIFIHRSCVVKFLTSVKRKCHFRAFHPIILATNRKKKSSLMAELLIGIWIWQKTEIHWKNYSSGAQVYV